MLGLGAGIIGLSAGILAHHPSTQLLPELPQGFAYVVADGQFVTYDGAYLILEL
ncbi:hypothetical protein SAMN05880582_1011745 [Rhizobium sp. RU20A]|nr:hypothetical protein SAMN05880582_1011745 [Rhizobium sp. RU20A]